MMALRERILAAGGSSMAVLESNIQLATYGISSLGAIKSISVCRFHRIPFLDLIRVTILQAR
jgi:hypothetical protein